jgi:site-specific recombinase XerD
MLVNAVICIHFASMSKKRIRIKDNARRENYKITVTPVVYKSRGVHYISHVVQGWKENGKWQRKRFKDLKKADEFAALKRIELVNTSRKQSLILTALTEDQAQEAVAAFDVLAGTYTLKQAVDYFLQNHRPPEYTISISDGLKLYIDEKERDGVRSRTIRGIKGIIRAYSDYSENQLVHEATPQGVQSYLRGLRAKDGVSPAKRKTWNNHRNELSQFFQWATEEDLVTNRPWRFNNPAEKIKTFTAARIAEQRPQIVTTTTDDLIKIFNHMMVFDDGSLVKVYALAYFAGIRPDIEGEMGKLSLREAELIDLKTGRINMPAEVAKNKKKRSVVISENLRAWLEAYADKPIMPVNFSDKNTKARKPFILQQDEARHSFISYHVALYQSIGRTALQAGNTEKMIEDHYLVFPTKGEGSAFFSIVPDMEKGEAIYSDQISETPQTFKVI